MLMINIIMNMFNKKKSIQFPFEILNKGVIKAIGKEW